MNQFIKNRTKSKNGMTVAEMLIVVAIIIILMGVAFIAVMNYQRNMAQLERDSIAKELFIAAQNHLTMAKSENYPGSGVDFLKDDQEKIKKAAGKHENGDVYYLMVNRGDLFDDTDADGNYMLKQMLPVGSIDEFVRTGGNYVIRYQPNIGKVMDVFYCSAKGSPEKYNYSFENSDYSDSGDGLLNMAGKSKAKKDARADYKNGKILGWFGGENLETLGHEISPPKLKLNNEKTLYAETWYGSLEDYIDNDVSLRLIVEGKQSGAKKYFDIDKNGEGKDPSHQKTGNTVLDDITTQDKNFGKLFKETSEGEFIPGEDLKVRVIAFCKTKLASIAESKVKEVNSLFEEISDNINEKGTASSSESTQYNLNGSMITVENANDDIPDTAYIKNFRHLENLDRKVSNLQANDTENKLGLRKAIQIADLNWNSFIGNGRVFYSNAADSLYDPKNSTSNGCYKPVDPMNVNKGFIYDGKKNTITGVKVDGKGSSGLFGVATNCNIKNIKLSGFDVKSSDSYAGTLAGSVTSTDIINIVAYGADSKVSGTNAGGLVGNISGGKTEYCAAAVKVAGTAAAGGLIGTGADSASIKGCYSGGHTYDGAYDKWIDDYGYDVEGTNAGGLIGSFTGHVENSYSTCSVSSSFDNGNAGGLAGSANGIITNCYCTGLVNGADDGNKNAFIGTGNLTSHENDKYYAAVNEELEDDIADPFDVNTESFKAFSSNKCNADAYDDYIKNKYSDGYIYKSVADLSGIGTEFPKGYSKWNDFFITTHYGDWPSPELFLINVK